MHFRYNLTLCAHSVTLLFLFRLPSFLGTGFHQETALSLSRITFFLAFWSSSLYSLTVCSTVFVFGSLFASCYCHFGHVSVLLLFVLFPVFWGSNHTSSITIQKTQLYVFFFWFFTVPHFCLYGHHVGFETTGEAAPEANKLHTLAGSWI